MIDRDRLEAVLTLAERFGPVFPMTPAKRPYTLHGSKDASRDPAIIRTWCERWPDAEFALLTGEASGIVALDVDIKNGVDGRDTLETDFGAALHPESPTDHSPSGGYHILFRWPGHFVKSGTIGRGVEVKGDSAWVTLPPGLNRYWDPHCGLDTPLAPMPAWMLLPEPAKQQREARPARSGSLTRYGERSLDGALRAILAAGAGEQRHTLNRESYGIGQLVAGAEIPTDLAIAELCWAADRVQTLDGRRPWRSGECRKLVKAAFVDGQTSPRCAA